MTATHDVVWEQGEDFMMHLVYKENDTPVDLTDYEVRMDIAPATPANALPILSLNSADFTGTGEGDVPLDAEGGGDNEVTTDTEGNIFITVGRNVTLPTGIIGTRLNIGTKFVYDIFVRDTTTNRQKKLAKGGITVNRSVTLWQ